MDILEKSSTQSPNIDQLPCQFKVAIALLNLSKIS